MFSGVAPSVDKIDSVFLFILSVCVFLLVLITATMIYFVIKYDKKRHPNPVNIEGNVTLEIIWTVIPTILVLVMFFYGWSGYAFVRNVPPGAMVVKVFSRMWSWEFEYDNKKRSPVLNVPLGKPVKLLLYSDDVIHGFYVPAFRIQQDIVPGMETYAWFQADKMGSYDVLCSQFCGYDHAAMLTKIVVMTQEDFNSWYGKSPEVKYVSSGEKLFKEKGCMVCHTPDNTQGLGPKLKGIMGNKIKVLTDGKEREIIVDDEYLKRSIKEPEADILKGFEDIKMPPTKGLLNDKEIEEIIKYINIM